MIFIRITVNNDIRAVQFWCDKTESQDSNLLQNIEKLYSQYSPDRKYRKVIYRSGNENLADLTNALFSHNLR